MERDHAIVVGIKDYPYLSPLQGPGRDADEFTAWLTGAGCVPTENVHRVISTATGPKPRTDDIDEIFLGLVRAGRRNDGQLGRRLYIYFSGHGIAPDLAADESALLMANAARDSIGFHIPGRLYASALKLEGLFEEIVLLMDCCRDDYERFGLKPTPWTPVKSVRGGRTRHFYGFATRWGLKARERPIYNGRVDEANGQYRGVFTTALLEALNGAMHDEARRVTGAIVARHVHNRVRELLPDQQFEKPQFDFDSGDDIIFVEEVADLPVRDVVVRFAGPTGQLLLIGPGGQRTSEKRTGDTMQLRLAPGLYVLRDTVPDVRERGFQVLGEGVTYVEF